MLDLRIFVAIYDFGSFGRAAELLNLSQPALSRRMLALEQHLQVQLFERSTRKVKPTSAAIRLEPLARRILAELDTSIMSIVGAAEPEQGYIVIASIPSAALFFLPTVVKQFHKRYPQIRVRIIDRAPQEALNCVVNGEVEFGINMMSATGKDVVFTHLISDPYVLVCHPRHPLAANQAVTWRDLIGHPLVGIGHSNSENRALLDRSLTKTNVHLNWFFEVTNVATALALVEAELAVSVLPRLSTPPNAGRKSGLVTNVILDPKISRDVGIVERRKSYLSVGARYFRDMLLSDWRNCDLASSPSPPR